MLSTERINDSRLWGKAWVQALWWCSCGALTVALASYVSWFSDGRAFPEGAHVLVIGTIAAFAAGGFVTQQLARHDLEHSVYVSSLFVMAGLFLLLVAALLFLRAYYSRSFLVTAFGVGTVCNWIGLYWQEKSHRLVFGVLDGIDLRLPAHNPYELVTLTSPAQSLQGLDGLVVDYDHLDERWQPVVAQATVVGLSVYQAANFYEMATGRVSLNHVAPSQARDFHLHIFYAAIKRLLDLAAALLLLPALLLLTGVIGLAIKLDTPGPVFFRQARVGQQGRVFVIFKFRSMQLGADDSAHSFAEAGDPRVTRLGRFLRRTRIDELPQVFNVLRGEMSLIGPRPEQVGFVKEFEGSIPFYTYRHLVKPGITGWAQVSHGYAASVASTRDKLEYDLYYAKYYSIWLDLLIVFRTIRTIITGFGVR